jgi:hypothetical protein
MGIESEGDLPGDGLTCSKMGGAKGRRRQRRLIARCNGHGTVVFEVDGAVVEAIGADSHRGALEEGVETATEGYPEGALHDVSGGGTLGEEGFGSVPLGPHCRSNRAMMRMVPFWHTRQRTIGVSSITSTFGRIALA